MGLLVDENNVLLDEVFLGLLCGSWMGGRGATVLQAVRDVALTQRSALVRLSCRVAELRLMPHRGGGRLLSQCGRFQAVFIHFGLQLPELTTEIIFKFIRYP